MCGQRCYIEIKLFIVAAIEFQRFRPLPYADGTFTVKLKIKIENVKILVCSF